MVNCKDFNLIQYMIKHTWHMYILWSFQSFPEILFIKQHDQH